MFCEQRWREEVCGKRSLDLFSEVKRKLVLEDYLKCVRGRRGVWAWFGFRSRSVGLRAEVSGWSNRNVVGTCVLCCMDEEEDVEHVLLRCGAYAEERRKLWSVLEDCVDGGRWRRVRSWWFCWGRGGYGVYFSTCYFGEEEEVDWSWRVSGILTVIVCWFLCSLVCITMALYAHVVSINYSLPTQVVFPLCGH